MARPVRTNSLSSPAACIRWLACLAALAVPGAGHAQGSAQDDDQGMGVLKVFMTSQAYRDITARALSGIPPAIFTRCATLVARDSSVTILQPVSAGPQGSPVAGRWKQAFPVSGCGNDTVLNLYFSVGADGKPQAGAALPGTTLADPLLQRDALLYANLGATRAVADCKNFLVIDTRAPASGTPPGAGRLKAPWSETWTLSGCNRKVDVRMDFIPDSTGTTIAPRDAVIRPD
ncbi:hypothetical protein J8I29_22785 [Labrys sp. LIt4]|uniref:hypothetical protein n=1 Tax=Labrys sp. LIt4 TaxID=2821355 RepID=UPI001ADEF029|nr:hypothetical protein [Labrys sp. LIt4]MBP0582172.1 hypothetical protein [Labrys sp. LIt4]